MNLSKSKYDNSYIYKTYACKTKWSWTIFLLIGLIAVGTTSCNKDDEVVNNSEEAESAWMYSHNIIGPEGGVTYLGVAKSIPSEPNTTKELELGFDSEAISFKENPYTWNGSAATLTKWNVDKVTLELSVEGILSFASLGITSIANAAFTSETQAFVFNLNEGLVVEWNPTDMNIIEVYQVDPLPGAEKLIGGEIYGEFRSYITLENKILLPTTYIQSSTCCEYVDLGGTVLAVFDPVSKTLAYNQDDRLISSKDYLLTDNNGFQYVIPAEQQFLLEHYYNVDMDQLPNPYAMLKVNPDGSFDENYSVDFSELLNTNFIARVGLVYDNEVVVSYIEGDHDFSASFDDRWAFWGDGFKSSIINLDTKEVRDFDAFDGYVYTNQVAIIEGVNYFIAWAGLDQGGLILRQESAELYTILSNAEGPFRNIGKLW
ncbi:MAG: hypothetical protein AAGI25_11670 [Bacteroidota bacterium]